MPTATKIPSRPSIPTRPSILRAKSSYGPDIKPMETFGGSAERNKRLNSLSRPPISGMPLKRPIPRKANSPTHRPPVSDIPGLGSHPPAVHDVGPFEAPRRMPSAQTKDTSPRGNGGGHSPPTPVTKAPDIGSQRKHDTNVTRQEKVLSDPNPLGTPRFPETNPRSQSVDVPAMNEWDPRSDPLARRYASLLCQFRRTLSQDTGTQKWSLKVVDCLIRIPELFEKWVEDVDNQVTRDDPKGQDRSQDLGHIAGVPLREVRWYASDLFPLGIDDAEVRLPAPPFVYRITSQLFNMRALSQEHYDVGSNRSAQAHNLLDMFSNEYSNYGRDVVFERYKAKDLLHVLVDLLQFCPEPPLHPDVFDAFCFISSRSKATRHMPDSDRIEAAKVLFKLMPEAHSAVLSFVAAFLNFLAKNDSTDTEVLKLSSPEEVADLFAVVVCAPRDPAQYIAQSRKDSGGGEVGAQAAERQVHEAAKSVLAFILSHWDQISLWPLDLPAEGSLSPDGPAEEDDKQLAPFFDRIQRVVRRPKPPAPASHLPIMEEESTEVEDPPSLHNSPVAQQPSSVEPPKPALEPWTSLRVPNVPSAKLENEIIGGATTKAHKESWTNALDEWMRHFEERQEHLEEAVRSKDQRVHDLEDCVQHLDQTVRDQARHLEVFIASFSNLVSSISNGRS